jgi:hypothetical protein
MNAGAGNLTAGIQPGDRGATEVIGQDATRRIVLGRCDRDEISDRVDTATAARLENGREALQPGIGTKMTAVEPDVRQTA